MSHILVVPFTNLFVFANTDMIFGRRLSFTELRATGRNESINYSAHSTNERDLKQTLLETRRACKKICVCA